MSVKGLPSAWCSGIQSRQHGSSLWTWIDLWNIVSVTSTNTHAWRQGLVQSPQASLDHAVTYERSLSIGDLLSVDLNYIF